MGDADAEQRQHGGHRHRHRHRHFLVVSYGIQSHVNPCRILAHRLARLDLGGASGSVLATVAFPLFMHRRIFPSSCGDEEEEEATDGVVCYVPYSDGVDDGIRPRDSEARARGRRASFESLSAVVARLAARGRPVTCVVCSMAIPSAMNLAREHAIPLVVFWIQTATVLAACYHYLHGHRELLASHAAEPAYEVTLPGLRRPLRIRDFPSFLVDTTGGELSKLMNELIRELFEFMDQGRVAKILVNTFDELEPAALAAMRQHLDVLAVGPVVGSPAEARIHLFDHTGADVKRYTEWLDAQPARSVVYISFGSICTYSKQQMEEMAHGLRLCRRPYLLVLRKEDRQEDVSQFLEDVDGKGMVVGWCDQPEVLSHPSVGCFVTHCGWNSTLEAMALGVPIVAAPKMFDQPTNAFLVEEDWAAGVRAEPQRRGESIVYAGPELARCVELVMGDGARATETRHRTEALKAMARQAAVSGGTAERSLWSFVMDMAAQAPGEDTAAKLEIDVVQVENSVTSISMHS